MHPFLIILIVFLIVNILFLAMSIVHTYIYEKSKPEDMVPRLSVASSMLNRHTNPRLSLQPQVTIYDLIRVSIGSAHADGKRTSRLGPRQSINRDTVMN